MVKNYRINFNTLEYDYIELINKLKIGAPVIAPAQQFDYEPGVKDISDLIVMFSNKPDTVLHHTNILKDFGEVKATLHPHLPLYIFNYTEQATFNREWRTTERVSRGLIFDFNGRVMGRGFDKFFNLGEMPETQIEELPSEFIVTDKLDGSLGITYRLYQGGPVAIATRGNFVSEQAMVATLMLHYNYPDLAFYLAEYGYLCPLFEIIYPANSHNLVVRYGELEDITLIGLRHLDQRGDRRNEALYSELLSFGQWFDLPLVKQVKGITNLSTLVSMTTDSKGIEGWVISYPENNRTIRIKIKTVEYLQLQKLVLHLTHKQFRYMMMKELMPAHITDQTPPGTLKLNEYLVLLPEEFRTDATQIANDIVQVVLTLIETASGCYQDILIWFDNVKPARKDFAKIVLDSYKNVSQLLFMLYDNKTEQELNYAALKSIDHRIFKTRLE